MTTLVTGCGLVGVPVVELLGERGDEVVVLDLDATAARSRVDAEVVAGDVRDLDDLARAVSSHRPERIVHTAALLTPAGRSHPHETIAVNLMGTANVLEAARAGGVRRVVLCSSVVVYDASLSADRAVAEDHPCAARTVYAATKLAAEQLGRAYAAQFGLEFAAVRLAAVYGPAPEPGGGVSRLVLEVARAALRDGRADFPRRWPGRQDLVFSRDAAAGLVAAACAATLVHDAFNVGGGTAVSVDDVARALADHTGADVRVSEPRVGEANPDVVTALLDLRRSREELGYAPRYDLRQGLGELVAWLRAGAAAS